MKHIFFSLIMCFLIAYSVIAAPVSDSLPVVHIANEDLRKIIDSTIHHEKKCSYYTPQLTFSIMIMLAEDSVITVQISGIDYLFSIENSVCCFMQNDHLFIVSGKHIPQRLFPDFFKSIGNKRKIGLTKENKSFAVSEDDSFSHWLYKYKNEKFQLIEKNSYCK